MLVILPDPKLERFGLIYHQTQRENGHVSRYDVDVVCGPVRELKYAPDDVLYGYLLYMLK